ncbi:Uncharacterised protein [Shigella sonnei]|nr:Uncharacterised protein [Shigella sonnei]
MHATRCILYFILNDFSRSASGVIFARAEHIGVIPLPFVADEFLQLLEGETSDVGKLALPFTFQKRKFPRQRAGQGRFPASIRTDKRPTITRV